MKNLFLFLCGLVVSASVLSAQVPGFMGKRIHITYGLNVSPSFSRNTVNKGYLNAIQELQGTYVTATRWEMGLMWRGYKTIYDNRQNLSDGKDVKNYYNLSNHSFGVVFKHFKTNYVAPWGAYFMFGPVLNVVTATYDPYMHVVARVNNHDTLLTDFGSWSQRFYKGDLFFGWGQQHVYGGRILVDYGFNCQLLVLLNDFRITGISKILYTRSNYIEETSAQRARGMNRFNLFLKLGFLL